MPDEQIADGARVFSRVKYKEKTYYAIGADGDALHLTPLSGAFSFWAKVAACEILTEYRPAQLRAYGHRGQSRVEYMTLGTIRRFINSKKPGGA